MRAVSQHLEFKIPKKSNVLAVPLGEQTVLLGELRVAQKYLVMMNNEEKVCTYYSCFNTLYFRIK
jgi:hypothetical protein